MAGQVTVRDVIFSIIIFTSIIAGCFLLISSAMPTEDNSFAGDGGYNMTINKFNTVQAQMNTTTVQFRNAEQKQSTLGILNDLLETSWGVLKTVWVSIDVMTAILQDISDSFGVPLWFVQVIMMFILLSIVFALMAAWFRWLI